MHCYLGAIPIRNALPLYKSKSNAVHSLQVLVEPNNSLAERLLLGPLLNLVTQIGTNGEAVRDAAEQVDLPRVTSLNQSFLGFVTELGCEDRVGFCYSDRWVSMRFSGIA